MDHRFLPRVIHGEEKTVVAEAATENALLLLALESLHVPLKGVEAHPRYRPRDAPLNGFRKRLKIPLCGAGELTDPVHL